MSVRHWKLPHPDKYGVIGMWESAEKQHSDKRTQDLAMLRGSLQVLHGVTEWLISPDCVLCETVGPELYRNYPLFLNCLRYGAERTYIP